MSAGVTGLGDGAAARDEDGGGGGPCDLYLSMWYIFEHDMYMNMYEMLYDSWDRMYVFDMVVYVGMCPNSYMMYDVLCVVAWVDYVLI